MKMNTNTIILVVTTLSSGLMAGLFYTWSISVTPGLAKVGTENYLQAFQSMNRAILNPAFFIFFMGLVIRLPRIGIPILRINRLAVVVHVEHDGFVGARCV